MSTPQSRFTTQHKTTHDRLATNTVGLVALSDFRKRRAELVEQQEKEAREAAFSGTSTPERSLTGTPVNASDTSETERQAKKRTKKEKKKQPSKALVSFGGEDEEDAGDEGSKGSGAETPTERGAASSAKEDGADKEKRVAGKVTANATVGVVPRAVTKSALRREAAEREALRKQFLVLQAAVKASEIAIPFVFYDGADIPGGVARVRKGDFVWLFLDRSRKVGAEMGVGSDKNSNARREWARVSVDDLMLVRGSVIIPHHYEFYFFIVNRTLGPGGRLLFDYSAEPSPTDTQKKQQSAPGPLLTANEASLDTRRLEGASDDPSFTKVVDRRWYERNKHIYPASVWQEFDPEKDYQSEIRRDLGGNTFFFSK